MLHQEGMRLALLQAWKAFDQGEVPIGAVVVQNDEIIAAAHNEKERRSDPTAHAEILAIRKAADAVGSWRLPDAILYVTLEPCPMCAGAILQARLKQIVYGCADLKGGAVGSVMNVLDRTLWNHRVEVTAGILEEECSEVLKSFFRKMR